MGQSGDLLSGDLLSGDLLSRPGSGKGPEPLEQHSCILIFVCLVFSFKILTI